MDDAQYQVIIPEQLLMSSEDTDLYSQMIRELNQKEIDKLPIDQQQDAISATLQVIAELNQEEIDEITRIKKESVGTSGDSTSRSTSTIEWENYGDIVITLTPTWTFGPLKWNHGHAGILDFNKNKVIEANPGNGVERKTNYKTYWAKAENKTDELYVGGATQDKYRAAVNYATKQIGKPYTILTTLGNTDKWYCSKLVYKAWLSAGYNVGDHYKDSSWKYDVIGVTPKQILWDDNVFFYKKVS